MTFSLVMESLKQSITPDMMFTKCGSHWYFWIPSQGWWDPSQQKRPCQSVIKKHISKNKGQVFIICPFIVESESMDSVKAAVKEFDFLKNEVFSDCKLDLIHGKLKIKEKSFMNTT